MNVDIQGFVEIVCDAFVARSAVAPDGARIAEHVRTAARSDSSVVPELRPGCAFLAEAVRLAQQADDPALGRIAEMIAAASPYLPWILRNGLPDAAEDFPLRHANAMFVGELGLESSEVTVGLTVMGPHTTYTNHSHPPEEAYLVLTPGEWRQNAGRWKAPGVGGVVYNPPGIIHSMRSGDVPLLAVWILRPVD
jgi:quercetin dioxygenase-like cupin family protein